MDLSIVVPCFNEEQGVQRLHEALAATLPEIVDRYEVILVDDGSTDGTLETIRRISEADPALQYVSLSRNFGKEAALVAGLGRTSGQRVAIMDADLQHPPELLARMVDLLDAGYDQAVARRSRHGDPKLRSVLSRTYYRVVDKLADVRLEDGVGDFRMFTRKAVDALLSLPESNRFSKGLFAWIGFDTATVDYHNVARSSGASKWTLGGLVNYGMDGIISFNTKPLRAAIYLGSVITVLAFCYAAFVAVDALFGRVTVPGYATLMIGIAGFGGIQLLFLGVIGEYLGRIYSESKRRPQFLVKDASPRRRVAQLLPSQVPEERAAGSAPDEVLPERAPNGNGSLTGRAH